jgi:hypothetical protein
MGGGHGYVFELDEELSEGDCVGAVVITPKGEKMELYAEVELSGRALTLRQFAIYGQGIGANAIGLIGLRQLASAAMEVFDVDSIRIEKAWRTSGANPGRDTRPIEFRRRGS